MFVDGNPDLGLGLVRRSILGLTRTQGTQDVPRFRAILGKKTPKMYLANRDVLGQKAPKVAPARAASKA